MPNDPLAQILAGLPDEADYDAVHAALMATERGRRFLTEYADRNRHADTTDVSAAIERLSDIAFMLHERPVEATLCDGLDAAVREVSGANMRSQSAAEDVRKAAELLHALASRVSAMMTRSIGGSGTGQPAGENVAAESAPGAGLFELATDDGETFAEAVAALAASLPTLADAPNEPAEAAPEPESGQGAQAPAIEAAPSDDALLPVDEAQETATETEVADDSAAPAQFTSPQSSAEVSLSEAVLSQAFSDDYFASANFSGEAAAPEETGSERALSEEPPSEDVLPAQNFPTDPVPEEDLADLFEPQPVPTTPIEAAAPVTADNPVPAEPPAEPARVVPPPPARAIPRPPGSDPLAAVRDLSEEELIALFS
jgi:hypothetical protein